MSRYGIVVGDSIEEYVLDADNEQDAEAKAIDMYNERKLTIFRDYDREKFYKLPELKKLLEIILNDVSIVEELVDYNEATDKEADVIEELANVRDILQQYFGI